MKDNRPAQLDFLLPDTRPDYVQLDAGAVLLPGFALHDAEACMLAIHHIAQQAPFRKMHTPGGGQMSVAMTCCGTFGWISTAQGYSYTKVNPFTGQPWPDMPAIFQALAHKAAQKAGFAQFQPNACLINSYSPGARMGLHQDRDEGCTDQPVVSLSFGLEATFLWGGLKRSDPTRQILLKDGDVLVWGGPDRLRFHGVKPIHSGAHIRTGETRLNITFRFVTS